MPMHKLINNRVGFTLAITQQVNAVWRKPCCRGGHAVLLPGQRPKHRRCMRYSAELGDFVNTDPYFSSVDDEAQPDAWKLQDAKEIIGIALPTLGTVSIEPLMSLIDTACIGQVVGRIELAALGPNTALFNLVFQIQPYASPTELLCIAAGTHQVQLSCAVGLKELSRVPYGRVLSFCGVATTNVVAGNSLTKPGLTDKERAQREQLCSRILCYAATVATLLGTLATVGMSLFGQPLLQLLGASTEMIPPGMQYLVVRCLASPAVLLCAVLNGAFVGLQDAVTPLKVCALAGVVNLVGDIALIMGLHMGITGAAVATTFSQYAALAYAAWVTWQSSQQHAAIPIQWVHRGYRSASGFLVCCLNLSGGMSNMPLYAVQGFPSIEALRPFGRVAVSLMSRTLFGMVAYTAMTAAATKLGTVEAAAHQIGLQVFWVISFGADAISIALQTLIARDVMQPRKVRRIAWVMLRLALGLGVLLALISAVVLSLADVIFTRDALVLAAVRPVIPQVAVAEFICAFTLMFDGFSIGTGQVANLPIANFLGLCVCTVGCSLAGVQLDPHGSRLGLPAVYWSLVAFLATRLGTHIVLALRNRNLCAIWWQAWPPRPGQSLV